MPIPNRFLKLFEPPVFPGDPEKTQGARVLTTLTLVIGVVSLVFLFIGVPFVFTQRRLITGSLSGCLLLGAVLARVLTRLGRVKTASIMLIVIFQIIVNILTYLGGGFESKGELIYSILVVLPFLLLDFWGALVSALAATASVVYFSYLGWSGVILPRVLPGLPLGLGLLNIGILWIICISAFLSRQAWKQSEDEARRELELRILSEGEKDKLKERLFQSRKMESLGRMAGSLTHDFHNLLSVISIRLQMLQRQRAQDEFLVSEIEKVEETVHSAVCMTRSLLNFAKAGELKLELAEMDQIIRESQPVLSHLLGPQAKLETRLGAPGVKVMVDRSSMEQVFQNLIVNAKEALEGEGLVLIQTEAAEVKAGFLAIAPGSYFLLRISDNGRGMTPETKDKIFEPFFSTKEKGTGLGLATVFSVVQRHKGSIEVDSEPGKGTVFSIYLPANR